MSFAISAAHRLGYETRSGHAVWAYPLAAAFGLTVVTSALLWAGVLKDGYFSPYVAATAAVAARVCVRAGLLAALLSIVMWDFFVVPPLLVLSAPSASEVTAWLAAIAACLLVAPRINDRVTPDRSVTLDPSGTLPFVRRKTERNGVDHTRLGASCWDVRRTGNWAADDHYGREIGRLWVDQRQDAHAATPPLAFILSDMIEVGEFSGVEAGFANAVERAVAAGEELPLSLAPLVADHEANNFRLQG